MTAPRIIAGRHRGRRLEVPPGDSVRPSAERLREALFAMLEHRRPPLAGARFLDLFAGSGAIGLEALSRGAAEVLLVEVDRQAAGAIRRNIEKLGVGGSAALLIADATRLPVPRERFDIAYLDPPYGSGLAEPALAGLLAAGWLAADWLAVVELAAREPFTPPAASRVVDERRYGAGRIVLLRPAAEAAGQQG